MLAQSPVSESGAAVGSRLVHRCFRVVRGVVIVGRFGAFPLTFGTACSDGKPQ